MRPTTLPRARSRARRAWDPPAAHVLARAGLTARGIIYMVIGWLAVLVALSRGSHETDQQGALQLLAGKPYGPVSLLLLGHRLAPHSVLRPRLYAYVVSP